MFSFVQRLPTDLGRTFIAARQGQASNKAEQKLRETHNNNAGQAAVAGFARRCDQSGRHLISIPPRPDDRYPDWVTGDRFWPNHATRRAQCIPVFGPQEPHRWTQVQHERQPRDPAKSRSPRIFPPASSCTHVSRMRTGYSWRGEDCPSAASSAASEGIPRARPSRDRHAAPVLMRPMKPP